MKKILYLAFFCFLTETRGAASNSDFSAYVFDLMHMIKAENFEQINLFNSLNGEKKIQIPNNQAKIICLNAYLEEQEIMTDDQLQGMLEFAKKSSQSDWSNSSAYTELVKFLETKL